MLIHNIYIILYVNTIQYKDVKDDNDNNTRGYIGNH